MGRRFNEYMKHHFSDCRVLAKAYDLHRNRDVTIYLIPGELELVGVSDGTDCWVAPTCIDPFSVSVKRMIEDIKNGKEPEIVQTIRRRQLSVPKQDEAAAEEPQPDPGRRLERRRLAVLAADPEVPSIPRRRLLHP